MKLGYKVRKYFGFSILYVILTIGFTGCAGISFNGIKEQGKQLISEGNKMNETLAREAKETNEVFLKSKGKIGDGWISVLEKISEDNTDYRIKYVLEDDLENKSSVKDIESFIDDIDLDNWSEVNEFPDEINNHYVFFIQEKTSKKSKTTAKYKNVANLRFLEEDRLVLVTVVGGLIDLSDEFIPKNNYFTSVYKVPESVINYLLTAVEPE